MRPALSCFPLLSEDVVFPFWEVTSESKGGGLSLPLHQLQLDRESHKQAEKPPWYPASTGFQTCWLLL